MTATADRISFRYRLPRDDFNLDVAATLPLQGVTGVYGASGAGKTSLLRCIAGLEKPAQAEFSIGNDCWDDTSNGTQLPPEQRALGYVFQEPRLFPHLDVRGNLEYGLRRASAQPLCSVEEMTALLGLETLLARRPAHLSGGEAQRVAIGRAVLRAPRLLLMDEPVAAIDQERRMAVLPFIERIQREFALPMLYVSHSLDEICYLCDQLLVLGDGQLLASGDLQSVLGRTDLPLLGAGEAGAVVYATVADYDADDDLTRLTFSGGDLFVAGRIEAGQRTRVRIRANDVSLCRDLPSQSSILNRFAVTILDLTQDSSSSVLLQLEAGEDRLLARVTRRSMNALTLRKGEKVFAQVKTISVRRLRGWER